MFFILNIHSVVNLITNSSTVIYSYYDGCIGPAKDLIEAFAETMGITDVKASDMFRFLVLCRDEYKYGEYASENFNEIEDIPFKKDENDVILSYENNVVNYSDIDDWVSELITNIKAGIKEVPDWFANVDSEEDYIGYTPSTNLMIFPTEEKYVKLGKALIKFVESSDHNAAINN